MTEDRIERIVAGMVDRADARFLAGRMTQAEYDKNMRQIDEWAEARFAEMRKARVRESRRTAFEEYWAGSATASVAADAGRMK